MRVYGYTDSRDIVAVHLPIDEVVAQEIDPWRLDLFDPAPVTIEHNGQRLHFRRLRDLAFAYHNGSRWYIVSHDGVEPVAVYGETEVSKTFWVELTGITQSKRPFGYHFKKYLEFHPKVDPLEFKAPLTYLPTPANAVTLKGDAIEWCVFQRGLWQLNFGGEMFAEITVPMVVPKQIEYIMNLLHGFEPIVFGEAVRKAITGEPVSLVEVVVPDRHVSQLTADLTDRHGIALSSYPASGWAVYFWCDGCMYIIRQMGVSEGFVVSCRKNIHRYSVDGLYFTGGKHARGSRIAFADMGSLKARRLAIGHRDSDDRELPERLQRLKKAGYKESRHPDDEVHLLV